MERSGVSDLFLMWPEKVGLAAKRKTRHVSLAPYDIFHASPGTQCTAFRSVWPGPRAQVFPKPTVRPSFSGAQKTQLMWCPETRLFLFTPEPGAVVCPGRRKEALRKRVSFAGQRR